MATNVSAEATTAPTRRAMWLELFFDLVVVAAVAQLASIFHNDITAASAVTFVALYLAVWTVWNLFTLYMNVAENHIRYPSILLAMFGIAVMAAAIPQATGDRAQMFIAAFVVVRVIGLYLWSRTHKTLIAWPVQTGFGIIPWIISFWVAAPNRYILWGVGLAIDILLPIFLSNSTPKIPAWVQKLIDQDTSKNAKQKREQLSSEVFQVAKLDLPHLAERLGLFVIIVFGEAILQLVVVSRNAAWSSQFIGIAMTSFVLLIALWWPVFQYGFIASRGRYLAIRAVMPLHFIAVASITAIAAGLGLLAQYTESHVPDSLRLLLCGGIAMYYVSGIIGALLARQPAKWFFTRALPSIVLLVLIGVYGGFLSSFTLVVVLTLIVLWQSSYGWMQQRRSAKLATVHASRE